MRIPNVLLSLVFLLGVESVYAQKVMWMKPKQPIVCYGVEKPGTSHVPPPELFAERLAAGKTQATKSSKFVVTYIGFTNEAREAFQRAVDIWESILVSPVDIHVTANWAPLGSGVLGSATAGTFYANFDGAQQLNTWYPVALAEKMARRDLNESGDIDIFAQFNSNNNSWHYGLNGSTPAGQYDLVTVVLHELGHGLGFLDSYNITSNVASVGLASTGVPVVYDLGIQNGTGQNLFITTQSETDELRAQLTSNNLFYNSPRVLQANGNLPAKIYAPTTFSSGSSIAHLDESTFPGGTANALMTPQIGTGEANFNPGAIVQGMFSDMGWVFTYITHTALPNVEATNSPFVVKAVITSDAGPVASPKLFYNTGGANVEVSMQATANPNEYEATIPTTGVATTYNYFIAANDNLGRTYTKPGKRTFVTTGTVQAYFSFETGEDTKAPIVNHTAPGFILSSDTSFDVDAYITDNIGIASAIVEYSIDGVDQPSIDFELQEPEQDSIYRAVIDLGVGLAVGSTIRYKIIVTDNSSNSNQKTLPEVDDFEVSVEGLGVAVNSYENDFNDPSDDFFGNGFTISTPNGFENPAIHSEHPYINGSGFPDNERNLVYQLKVPVAIKSSDAFLQFDEVVLVEPGEPGSVFGDDDFWDYVVVEGSKDGGETWTPFANGYDARAQSVWQTRYGSANDGANNSTAVGDAALFRSRVIDMLSAFDAGDEVAIRFRLFIDESASGWGWAIDNLKIQTDIVAPRILHDHVDYVEVGETLPPLRVLARDAGGIESFTLFYFKNEEAEQSIVAGDSLDFTFELPLSAMQAGDVVSYKIEVLDPAGNLTTLPVNGYFSIKTFVEQTAVTQYSTDFTNSAADFVGNLFSIEIPAGLSNDALSSAHPYPTGFGLDSTSNLVATLLRPITIASSNTLIRFDEIAIVQGQSTTIPFGTEAFNDYVIVEGSKDAGETWLPFLNGYDAASHSPWLAAFNTGNNPSSTLFRSRLIDLTENGNFQANDEVLIRFRLFTDATTSGWGWAIDNLFIQDPITGIEPFALSESSLHPNPTSNTVVFQATLKPNRVLSLQLTNCNGQRMQTTTLPTGDGNVHHTLDLQSYPVGLYLLKAFDGESTEIRKIVKID